MNIEQKHVENNDRQRNEKVFLFPDLLSSCIFHETTSEIGHHDSPKSILSPEKHECSDDPGRSRRETEKAH
jgi:hypothetical protein